MHMEILIDPAQLEIKDTINEVKYGCLSLLVEVFMKVMNGLVITLEEDEIFMCLAVLLCEQLGARISIKSVLLHEIIFFCLSVFSSSKVLGKITSIQSKLSTAACWSWEEKRGNCEANLL